MTERIEFLSCFYPAFNEESNIAHVLDEALETLPRFAETFEVIVVDDGSTDRTGEVVKDYSDRHPEVRLEAHARNSGYGEALRTGLRTSKGDAVFFTDADRQFRLADLSKLMPQLDRADVVVGYRIKRNDPWHRLVVAAVYHRVLRWVFKLNVHDVDCAFKIFRREPLDRIVDKLQSRSAFISPEILIRAQMEGYGIAEVGVQHYPRAAGRPKGATPRVIARTIKEIIVMRRRLGPPPSR